jgi:hypothetical protein
MLPTVVAAVQYDGRELTPKKNSKVTQQLRLRGYSDGNAPFIFFLEISHGCPLARIRRSIPQ